MQIPPRGQPIYGQGDGARWVKYERGPEVKWFSADWRRWRHEGAWTMLRHERERGGRGGEAADVETLHREVEGRD